MQIKEEQVVGSDKIESHAPRGQREQHNLGTVADSVKVVHDCAAVFHGDFA